MTTTYNSIPQEVANEISGNDSLSGTTDVLMFNMHPVILFGRNTSSITKARAYIVDKLATIIGIVDGYVGWKCLGVSIVETSDDKTILVVFLKEI
jgi:hypothetical protein